MGYLSFPLSTPRYYRAVVSNHYSVTYICFLFLEGLLEERGIIPPLQQPPHISIPDRKREVVGDDDQEPPAKRRALVSQQLHPHYHQSYTNA